MESYNFKSIDEAITALLNFKKKGKNSEITIFTVDFDNDMEEKRKATPDAGCALVRKSKTIIVNEDIYIPHMQLFSVKQPDIDNIKKEGIMHDIIFGG